MLVGAAFSLKLLDTKLYSSWSCSTGEILEHNKDIYVSLFLVLLSEMCVQHFTS